MLLAGIVIGSLGTLLWQGYQSRDGEVGSGIRKMIESSRQQAEVEVEQQTEPTIPTEPQQTNYDFFTVLPEIEVVVSDQDPPETNTPVQKKEPDQSETDSSESKEPASSQQQSAYMLQAGSFNRFSDAERQKASLALIGLSSVIQKITIQGRGDFYRVRLGPYINHGEMVDVDERLRQEGIKALRLKVSKAG